jgi:hypothetical protein
METERRDAIGGRFLIFIEWLLVIAAVGYQSLIAPHVIWGDGSVRYQTLVELVDHAKISPARYSILHTFLAAPLYMLGKVFGYGKEFASYFNQIVFCITLLVLYRMLRRSVPSDLLRRMILLVVAASMFGHHVQTFYGEVLTACAAMLGIGYLVLDRPRAAGIAMCVAIVNTPVAIVGLGLCNGLWALRTRRWVSAIWPIVLSVALVALEYWWRRGSPTRSGYEGDSGIRTLMPYSGGPGFNYPILLGLLSLLFSFGKGILFFSPGLLLLRIGTPSQSNLVVARMVELGVAFSLGLLLAYAPWWSWYGGLCWGPRFLLTACWPASLILAQHLCYERCRRPLLTGVTVLAVLWSVWVSVNGTVFRDGAAPLCAANNWNLEALCWYVPEFSVLIYPFVKLKELTDWDKIGIYLGAVVAVVLTVPMLLGRVRNFIAHALAARGA